MPKNYREYLMNELKEAEKGFEKAKKEAVHELETMDPYMAQDYGAGYCAHVDRVTAAAAKVVQARQMLRIYGDFNRTQESMPADLMSCGRG